LLLHHNTLLAKGRKTDPCQSLWPTGKLDPTASHRLLSHLEAKYRGQFVRAGIESVAYQKALAFLLTEEMKRGQNCFEIVDLKG
jgi:hypothetical protein